MARRVDIGGLGNRTKTILHDCIFYIINPLCADCTFCCGLTRVECMIKLIYCDHTFILFLKFVMPAIVYHTVHEIYMYLYII